MSSSSRGRSLAEVMSPIEDEIEGALVAPETVTAQPQKSTNGLAKTDIAAVLESTVPQVVPVNVLVAPDDRRRLRQLSLDANTSLQKLGHEAWNLLLQKRGLPPLKPVTANVPSGRSRTQS